MHEIIGFKKTLEFGQVKGVKKYQMYNRIETPTDIGLLEGLTGVGLALIACENRKNCSSWDKLLFIN